MITTAIATSDPRVTVTPAPNGRALVQMDGVIGHESFTIINDVLTHDEIVALLSGLMSYALSNPRTGTEWAA